MEYLNVVGVQFRRAGKIYNFVAGEYDLRVGDDVVVDTDRGPSLAKVAQVRYGARTEFKDNDLKLVMRRAAKKDLDESGRVTIEQAERYAKDRVARAELNMRILKAETQFGGNKIIVYFSAPGRVDFRDLVKDLAGGLKARVELKQVGARDEAKLVGGLGICGREYCCSSFLREFVPVSIKMAKNQNLALNPNKVSGGCGRLLCCLTYENDTYTELRRMLPPKGSSVRVLDDGTIGKVVKADFLNQVLTIEVGEGQLLVVPVKTVEVLEGNAGRGAGGGRGDGSFPMIKAPAKEAGYKEEAAKSDSPAEDMGEAEAWGEGIDLDELGVGGAEETQRPQQKQNQSQNQGQGQRPQFPKQDQRDRGGPRGNQPGPAYPKQTTQPPTGAAGAQDQGGGEPRPPHDDGSGGPQDGGRRRKRRRNR